MQLRENVSHREFAAASVHQLHRPPGLQIDTRN
jgi:hypothetical protein